MTTPSSQASWFIARSGKPYGPVSDVEMRKLIELGHLSINDHVWREGWSDWVGAEILLRMAAEHGFLKQPCTGEEAEAQPAPEATGTGAGAAPGAVPVAAATAERAAPRAEGTEGRPSEPAGDAAAAAQARSPVPAAEPPTARAESVSGHAPAAEPVVVPRHPVVPSVATDPKTDPKWVASVLATPFSDTSQRSLAARVRPLPSAEASTVTADRLVAAALPAALPPAATAPSAPAIGIEPSTSPRKAEPARAAASSGDLAPAREAAEGAKPAPAPLPVVTGPEISVETRFGVAVQDRARHGGFWARHWRGKYPLARSFWLHGILFSAAFGLIGTVVLWSVSQAKSMPAIATALATVLSLGLLLIVWQFVGVWRAAQVSWRRGTRLGPILTWLVLIAAIPAAAQQAWKSGVVTREFIRIATGDGELGLRSYEVVLGGRELIVTGGISFGLPEEVQRKLDNNPGIEIIRLESPGGRIGPARELRKLIRDRKLTTYVERGCFSACTVAFLGGSDRVLRDGARLGFHRPSFPSMKEHELQPEINVERRLMQSLGIPDEFIERAFSTPHDKMWEPAAAELKSAKVITRITKGTEFGARPVPAGDFSKVERALLQNPLYAAMKSHAPADYQRMLDRIRAGALEGLSPDHFHGIGLEYSSALIARNVARTSNAAAVDYARALAQFIRRLEASDAGLCYETVFRSRAVANGEGPRQLPSEHLLPLTRAGARVLEDRAQRPAPHPTAEQVEGGKRAIRRVLSERHGDGALRVLEQPAQSGAERREACLVAASVYEVAAALPEAVAGPLLRHLLTQGG